jgi:cell division protein FtsQ
MNVLMRIAAWILAIALVTFPVVAVLNGWIAGSRWPMRDLSVTGEFRQISDQQIRAAVLPLVKNGFFAVDLDRVRVELSKLPWAQRVEVRKRWPDRLEVSLVEYKPLARWGKDRMLSENGETFPAPSRQPDLPLFEGPIARAPELADFYRQAKPLFLAGGLRIETLRLSARGSWSLALSDGTEVEIGRGDPQAKLTRFARMLPRLRATETRRLARADLRYTNGFALTWSAPAASPTTQAARTDT